jgi:hypothetical protein
MGHRAGGGEPPHRDALPPVALEIHETGARAPCSQDGARLAWLGLDPLPQTRDLQPQQPGRVALLIAPHPATSGNTLVIAPARGTASPSAGLAAASATPLPKLDKLEHPCYHSP